MAFPPSEYVGQTAVEQLIDAFGVDLALAVNAQHILREVLRGLAPDLLAAGFAVEAGIVSGTVHGPIGSVVAEGKSLMRTRSREADHVAVGADAARHLFAELQKDARR